MTHLSVNRRVSRPLIMAWCAWLLVSWAVNLSIDPPLMAGVAPGDRHEFAQRITPAVRGMMTSMIVALVLFWPAIRMTQRSVAVGQLLADLLSLTLVNQIVIWPLRTLTDWPLERTLLIDLHLIVWPGLAALLAWVGSRGDSGARRWAATIGCALLLLGGFVVGYGTGQPRLAAWSPVEALWLLCDTSSPIDPAGAAMRLSSVALAAAAGWWLMLLPHGRTSGEIGDNIDG